MADIDAEVAAVADTLRLAATRAERLQRIVDGYEVYEDGMPDPSAPFASKVKTGPTGTPILEHPRYALVYQYDDKGHYAVNLADTLAQVQDLAASEVQQECLISCYFDLDQLAGEEPPIYEDDIVAYAPEDVTYTYSVVRVDEELIEGEVARYLCLVEVGKPAPEDWDDWDERVHEEDAELVESVEPDERMPVRYGVAGVKTVVAFNTIPSP